MKRDPRERGDTWIGTALQKAIALLDAGADLRVVAPEPQDQGPGLARVAVSGGEPPDNLSELGVVPRHRQRGRGRRRLGGWRGLGAGQAHSVQIGRPLPGIRKICAMVSMIVSVIVLLENMKW